MFEKAKPGRDAFTFSLGGMNTISSFTIAPAIADDRINKIRDEHVRRAQDAHDENPRGWLKSRRQAAQNCRVIKAFTANKNIMERGQLAAFLILAHLNQPSGDRKASLCQRVLTGPIR